MANVKFPRQKLSINKKTKEWRKECVDSAEKAIDFDDDNMRQSYYNKLTNYNLYNDILDERDMSTIMNPFDIDDFDPPAKLQNHPISNTNIDLLYGEYLKRKFPFSVRVGNFDAISEKEEVFKKNIDMAIEEMLKQTSVSEDEFKQKLEEVRKDNSSYQDKREKLANHILQYEMKRHDVDKKLADGFMDLLIAGEEIFYCDVMGGDVIFQKLDPLNVYTVRSGNSPFIHDSDIICIEEYKSPGQIIDLYHDELTQTEIDEIEQGFTNSNADEVGEKSPHRSSIPIWYIQELNSYIDITKTINSSGYKQNVDSEGNIKLTRVFWKSMRKMKMLTYIDELGQEQKELVDEKYEPDTSRGQKAKTMWISEWWEGHKIGGHIYKRLRPRPIQLRQMDNPSICKPPIVGFIMNVNSSKAMSLMDRMKPYQYLYNAIMYRTELAITLNFGKIMRVPLHEIPEGWTMSQWLRTAFVEKLAVYDAFKEGNKGAAQGKLAGMMQQNNHVIDMELGGFIQQHISMLEYIEYQMGVISGIPPQRKAQVSTSEMVGNVERVLTQSSHITEKWFSLQDHVKKETLTLLLETAKYKYKNVSSKKLQYISEENLLEIITVTPDFVESEFDLHVESIKNEQEIFNTLKNLSLTLVQNDKADVVDLVKIYTSPSLSSMTRYLETSQKERRKREEAQMQNQLQSNEKIKQMEEQSKEADREKDIMITQAELDFKREELYAKIASEGTEVDMDKLKSGEEKIRLEWEKFKESQRANRVAEKQKDEEISIKRKQANKPKAS